MSLAVEGFLWDDHICCLSSVRESHIPAKGSVCKSLSTRTKKCRKASLKIYLLDYSMQAAWDHGPSAPFPMWWTAGSARYLLHTCIPQLAFLPLCFRVPYFSFEIQKGEAVGPALPFISLVQGTRVVRVDVWTRWTLLAKSLWYGVHVCIAQNTHIDSIAQGPPVTVYISKFSILSTCRRCTALM